MAVPPTAARPGLQVHTIGVNGDLTDDAGHFQAAYGATAGDRVLVRPDGYVGAIVSACEDAAMGEYLTKVGSDGHVALVAFPKRNVERENRRQSR